MFIGWIGAGLFLIAYFLLTIKKIQADKILYQLMNVAGGLCLIINAYSIEDHPTLYLNLLWTAIAVLGILKVQNLSAHRRDSKAKIQNFSMEGQIQK